MIRDMQQGDASELTGLMGELGYATNVDQMTDRMKKIQLREEYKTFVWEEDDRIHGMIGMTHSLAYHDDRSHIRVIAFIVRAGERGRGIGKQLMQTAENWGAEQGAGTIQLNSGNREERKRAHEIYRYYGFQGTATGFYKKL